MREPTPQMPASAGDVPRRFWPIVIGASALVVAFLFWLIYFQPVSGEHAAWIGYLPQVNAALNFTSFCLVLCGLRAIFRKQWQTHAAFMLAAGAASALFLVSYLIYHYGATHTTFAGTGAIRTVYLVILISHIILSVVLVPMLIGTFSLALLKRYSVHRKIARWTYPVWLYVSITGVLVFVLLRGFGQ